MGQMTSTSLGGQQPRWANELDPMGQARQHFLEARDQFFPIRNAYYGSQGSKRNALRPEFVAEREQFVPVRDWFHGLRDVPQDRARGLAALGPPLPPDPLRVAQPMLVPQMPGLPRHDGTVEGLLAILRKRTAAQTPKASPTPSGNSTKVVERDTQDDIAARRARNFGRNNRGK